MLPGVIVLSEINPLSVYFFEKLNPLYQDRQWLHLLSDPERERFSRLDLRDFATFAALMDVLEERATARGLTLVLRDYNYADFIGVPFIRCPPMRRVLCEAFSERQAAPAIGVVRHPIAQWTSLRKHVSARRSALSPAEFSAAYAAFAQDLGNTPVFRYEDLVNDPDKELRRICDCLQLPFDPGFRSRFYSFENVTGNLRRQADRTISNSANDEAPQEVVERFLACPALTEVAARFGYREATPGWPFRESNGCVESLVSELRRQVDELREGALEWMAEMDAKEEEIRNVHAEAELRKNLLEQATARIQELERPAETPTPIGDRR